MEELAVSRQCLLVETLAAEIAAYVLTMQHAQSVAVAVDKPNAIANADTVGVRIYRSR